MFDDPLALSRLERIEGGEERWHTLSMVKGKVLLIVAHTVSNDKGEEVIHIFSARKATKHEYKTYEEV